MSGGKWVSEHALVVILCVFCVSTCVSVSMCDCVCVCERERMCVPHSLGKAAEARGLPLPVHL